MVEKPTTLGIESDKDFDIGKIDPATARGLQHAMGAFAKLQEGVKKLKTENCLVVHVLWPTEAVLDGTYNLPPTKKLQ
jgi:hypothetical protein